MRRLPQVMKWPLTRAAVHWMYRRQIGHIAQMGCIYGPFFRDDWAIDAGRYLMRFCLEAARGGAYLHPFGNLVTNTRAKAWVESYLGIKDIWLVFRIGYTRVPPRSLRRDLEEVLVNV